MNQKDSDGYFYKKLLRIFSNQDFKTLLALAGLPLLDGFFIVSAGSQLWLDPFFAVSFGVTALSGAGCVGAAMALKQSLRAKVAQVLLVYALVLLGCVLEVLTLPILCSAIPDYLFFLTALFLFGLGMCYSGFTFLQKCNGWFGFTFACKFMLVLSAFNGLTHLKGIEWALSLDLKAEFMVLLAVGAGLVLTLGIGVLLGSLVELKYRSLFERGTAVSLCLMGLKVLGVDIWSVAILAPVLVAYGWALLNKLWVTPKKPPSGGSSQPSFFTMASNDSDNLT